MAVLSLAGVGLLPAGNALPVLLMQLGLGAVAAGSAAAAGLSFWSERRSDHRFPQSPLPPVLARLCSACGTLSDRVEPARTVCEDCGAPLTPIAWRRDTPEPLLVGLIALVATGFASFLFGQIGTGPDGFDALVSQPIITLLAAMTVALAAPAWLLFAQVTYTTYRGSVGYVAGAIDGPTDARAVARVAVDDTITTAGGSSRSLGQRIVPKLSLATSEDGQRTLRALRKLAAHEKLTIRNWRHVSWRRLRVEGATADDYRSSAPRGFTSEITEEPYVFAPDDPQAEAWSRGLGLAIGGSSPLSAYVAWLEGEPDVQARLVEAAARIEAEEEAADEEARADAAPRRFGLRSRT